MSQGHRADVGFSLLQDQRSAQQPLGFRDTLDKHSVQSLSADHGLVLSEALSRPSLICCLEQVPLSLSLLPLFMDEEIKAQNSQDSCPKSHAWYVAELTCPPVLCGAVSLSALWNIQKHRVYEKQLVHILPLNIGKEWFSFTSFLIVVKYASHRCATLTI